METVRIQGLRSQLSEYLSRAEGGEYILVTEGGRAIAQLGPAPDPTRTLRALAAAGKLQWSGGKPAGLRGVAPRGEPVADTVLRERR